MAFPSSLYPESMFGAPSAGSQFALPSMSPSSLSTTYPHSPYMSAPPSPYTAGHPHRLQVGNDGIPMGRPPNGHTRFAIEAVRPGPTNGEHGAVDSSSIYASQPFHARPSLSMSPYGHQQQYPMAQRQIKIFDQSSQQQAPGLGHPQLLHAQRVCAGHPGGGGRQQHQQFHHPHGDMAGISSDHILDMDQGTANYIMGDPFLSQSQRPTGMGMGVDQNLNGGRPGHPGLSPSHLAHRNDMQGQGHFTGHQSQQDNMEVQQEISMNINMKIHSRGCGSGRAAFQGIAPGSGAGMGGSPFAGDDDIMYSRSQMPMPMRQESQTRYGGHPFF